MPDELLVERVEHLEKTVEGLQTLPGLVAALGERVGSVETQILQLRAEMRSEFSDVRSEMRTDFAAVRREMGTEFAAVRGEMKVEFAAVRRETQAEFATVRGEMQTSLASAKTELRQEIKDDMLVGLANVTSELGRQIQDAAEEGKRHSRMLFEEVLGRIATLSEHRDAGRGRKGPGPRRKG